MTPTRPMARVAAPLALAAALAQPGAAETPPNALVLAWNIDAISTFDPAQVAEVVTDEILRNACDALVDFDPADESHFVPDLAESWDVSEDGLSYTFHLKEGLAYPDGRPGSAGDLAWSMQRVVRLGYGNSATLTEFGFTAENVGTRITAPDDRTLVLTLDRPYPEPLVMGTIAANRVAFMLDRETVEANARDGDMGANYLATRTACVGPYSLLRWNPGEGVMLQANADYATGLKPALERVLIRHVAETGTQRLLLEKGDVDAALDLTPDDLAELETSPDLRIERVLKPSLYYLAMNNADGPFADPKVRLAMRYLIDYDGLAGSVMKGVAVPRASFVQLGAFGALDAEEGQPFHLDLERAAALLAEAGYADGFEATLLIGSHPYGAPIAQTLKEQASKVGVELNIERMANSQLYGRTRARDFEAALLGFKTSVPDANGMASRHVFNPDNSLEAGLTQYPAWRSGYYDPEVNARVEAALFERDPETRAKLYEDLQRDMMERGPQAYIMQTMSSAGVRNTVDDWTWNGFRIYYDHARK